MTTPDKVVVHLLYRFEFGGVQSLIAECIRRTAEGSVRHVVICLADYDEAAITILGDVELIAINKPDCGSWNAHRKLFAELRRLKPAVLQTYNISTIEYALTGAIAGVPRRLHAEHGRGMSERLGNHSKYNLLRRVISPLIETFVTVTHDMQSWLHQVVGIPERKIRLIANGIDTTVFYPAQLRVTGQLVIGTVGRLDPIKAQSDLITAYARLRRAFTDSSTTFKLVLVGEGPMRALLEQHARRLEVDDGVEFLGARTDIADVLRRMDVFVLPSLSEAAPITMLEAMACGLPVIGTQVGGVPDLIGDNARGTLIAPSDPDALAAAVTQYVKDPELRRRHGEAARQFVVAHYDIEQTAHSYRQLYEAAGAWRRIRDA